MLWRKLHLNWRYAFGEFAIVVLGVLAAFWVESWNAERNDRLLEVEYVQSLLGDLKADSVSIDNALRRTEHFARSGLTVLESIREGRLDIPATEFAKAVGDSGLLLFPTYSRRTINDLMSTGNLRIIESEEVLAGIADYYASIDNGAQWQINWREYQIHLGKLIPEVIGLDGPQSLSGLDRDSLAPWMTPDFTVSADEASAILDRLIEHPHAGPAIQQMVRVQALNYRYSSDAKRRLSELVDISERYLQHIERR